MKLYPCQKIALAEMDDRYIKEVLREKLCRYCEWREDDGETEEICPV